MLRNAKCCAADPGSIVLFFFMGPGSATQRCTLHSVRDTRPLSFWDGPKDQTRNLEILRCVITHHSSRFARPGMTGEMPRPEHGCGAGEPDETGKSHCGPKATLGQFRDGVNAG